MRAGRLVALLMHLDHHRRATAPALAAELEVSVRTIYRDVSSLQAAGVPLWTEPGPHGGIRLLDGWHTRLDGLTADEAGVLFLAGAPSAAGALGLGTVLAAAQTKVMSTLPPELRSRAGRVRERFHLDAPAWFHRDEDLPHLATVSEAEWSGHRLDLHYRANAGRHRGDPAEGQDPDVRRRVDPLGLVLKGGIWYLVARHRTDVRTYRVGRITAAEPLADTFERPDGFDLATWWEASSAEFDRSLLRTTVTIRLDHRGRRGLADCTDPGAAAEALAHASPPDGGDWCEVVLAVQSPAVAVGQLIALGAHVEVLDPPEARAALATIGQTIAALNRDGVTNCRRL